MFRSISARGFRDLASAASTGDGGLPLPGSIPREPRGGSLQAGPDPAHDVVLVSSLDPRHLPASAVQVLAPDERIRMHAGTDPRVAQRRAAARVLLRCAVSSLDG